MSSSAWSSIKKATAEIKESILVTDEKRKGVAQMEAYWQKQQKFFNSIIKVLKHFVDGMDDEIKYLNDHWECTGMRLL